MIKEIRRLYSAGLSRSAIARAMGVHRNTVRKYLKEAAAEPMKLGESNIYSAPWSGNIDWASVRSETSRGVQLSVVWEEQISVEGSDIPYVSFWREYKRRYPDIPIDYHRVHKPAERCEFDFKGQDPGFGYHDSHSGEFVLCRLFGNILCFSQLFFVRASLNEKQVSMFESLAKSFEYFGGVPKLTGFDNAKAQVVRADRFDADLNGEFSYFLETYKTSPMPSRPGKPKDKNLIENALGVFWRWARPKLSTKTFYSLGELNRELEQLCDQFNLRVQKKYGSSRREKFDSAEKEHLLALPKTPYIGGFWKKNKVHADCHIQHEYNFYSVPYQLRGKEVDVRISGANLEVYHELERVAAHGLPTYKGRARYSTNKAHLPEAHTALNEATPQYVCEQASQVGPATARMIERLLTEASHPLTYLRRCQGILRFKKRYSGKALEMAAEFFQDAGLGDIKVKNIEQVIKAGSQLPKPKKVERSKNENLRGQISWQDTFH